MKCRRPAGFPLIGRTGGEPLKIHLVKERSTEMGYTKKRNRKRSRFTPRPDVAKAKAPKVTSPLVVNAALASFALLCLATAILTT